MPGLTTPRCRRWPARGREPRDERPVRAGRLLPGHPPCPRFRLAGTGQLLEQFVAFAAGADTVTIELALQWATLPAGRSRAWQAQRLGAVRGFARWLQATDPQAQVPPAGLLTGRTRR